MSRRESSAIDGRWHPDPGLWTPRVLPARPLSRAVPSFPLWGVMDVRALELARAWLVLIDAFSAMFELGADHGLLPGAALRACRALRFHDGAAIMRFTRTTPILRIFDEAKVEEFYVAFLGFTVDWEHRFEDELPLYLQISRDECVLHLSEHHGDCSPGAAVRIETDELDAFHQQLLAARYKYARPRVEQTPWSTREMSIADPFGNRLTFTSPVST